MNILLNPDNNYINALKEPSYFTPCSNENPPNETDIYVLLEALSVRGDVDPFILNFVTICNIRGKGFAPAVLSLGFLSPLFIADRVAWPEEQSVCSKEKRPWLGR